MIYKVILTRDETVSTTVLVEAKDDDEAEDLALEVAGTYGEKLSDWVIDEGNCHEPYVTGIEEADNHET